MMTLSVCSAGLSPDIVSLTKLLPMLLKVMAAGHHSVYLTFCNQLQPSICLNNQLEALSYACV